MCWFWRRCRCRRGRFLWRRWRRSVWGWAWPSCALRAALRAALLESGLDAERVTELVQDAQIKAQLLHNTERSVARGTFGSPTFFVGDEIFFGKDRLRDVEESILATRQPLPANREH